MGILDTLKPKKKTATAKTSSKTVKADAHHDHAHDDVGVQKQKTETAAMQKTHQGGVERVAPSVIVRPMISEKAAIAESQGKYTFIVHRDASKVAIKTAIKEIYGVTPVAVHVMHTEGKVRRFGKVMGRRSDWKKAIVTLKTGESISIHEGV